MFSRLLSAIKCSECGTTPAKLGGGSGWIGCDTCERIVCAGCYRTEFKQSSHCTAHDPWGKWLRSGTPRLSQVEFR
jgi:hypothetical protein